MDIDLYCNDGSPLGIIPQDIYGRGLGGAELSMVTWAETMAARGHRIRIYNNPPIPGDYNGVAFLPQADFTPHQDRDVFIAYRSPNPYLSIAKAKIKIHWSTDQYTIGDFGRDIFPYVDRIVCISPFHIAYHKRHYNADPNKIGYLDLGGREDYDQPSVEKIPGRCIFCSIPDRGLDILRRIWPQIKERAPHASLVVTSDYTLWGNKSPMNYQYRLNFLPLPDIIFLGKVGRRRLVREQLSAEIMSYPCIYDELFCISAAECQIAGALPVTSNFGALPTTNEWGIIKAGDPLDAGWQRDFAETIAFLLNNREELRQQAARAAKEAKNRFDWNRICAQWERLIETGEFAA